MQETSANLTLSHDLCLPGYFLENQECICEESGTVVLCDPERRGILLAVSRKNNSIFMLYYCGNNRMDCGQHHPTGVGNL